MTPAYWQNDKNKIELILLESYISFGCFQANFQFH